MPYCEFRIRISEPFKEALLRRLSEAGSLGAIENDDELVVYFPGAFDLDTVKTDLVLLQALLEKTGPSHKLTFQHAMVPDRDWNERWKKSFQPIDIGRQLTILPPWEEKRPGRINLIIDPAMAFGTGHHETTRSCLVLMEKYAGAAPGKSFLDLGAGTGILAIAARKLGFLQVAGIDTDLLAVDAAKLNIEINGTPDIDIREGSLAGLDARFEMIAANLISGVLVQLAQAIADHLADRGLCIQSGILLGQEDEVIVSMEQAGLTLVERYPDGKWVSLVVQR